VRLIRLFVCWFGQVDGSGGSSAVGQGREDWLNASPPPTASI